MKTTITIEPMQPDSMFVATLPDKTNVGDCYEMFIVTEHPTQAKIKTITNFPITPKDHQILLSTINFGVDFTQKKMQEYMERK